MLQAKRILQNSHCCSFETARRDPSLRNAQLSYRQHFEKTHQSGIPFQMFGGTNMECKTNVEYNKIMSDIKSFLSNYCIHEWTTDDIDITPEISQKITYCELCETCTVVSKTPFLRILRPYKK
jgi:hypothetical protein